jgi:hypothetical protein
VFAAASVQGWQGCTRPVMSGLVSPTFRRCDATQWQQCSYVVMGARCCCFCCCCAVWWRVHGRSCHLSLLLLLLGCQAYNRTPMDCSDKLLIHMERMCSVVCDDVLTASRSRVRTGAMRAAEALCSERCHIPEHPAEATIAAGHRTCTSPQSQ